VFGVLSYGGDKLRTATLRAAKGVINVTLTLQDNAISNLTITGDFFVYPEEALNELEKALIGCKATEKTIRSKIIEFYESSGISTPGISQNDWVKVLLNAIDTNP
jgi:hypothetical protein